MSRRMNFRRLLLSAGMLPVTAMGSDVHAAGPAAGPERLASMKEGERIGRFRAQAIYLNHLDRPVGGRFVHENGMPVDVLFFASVPQVSVYAKTLPVSEMGEPHTGEHLLIGKGIVGQYLNLLLDMRLADHTAGTYPDHTVYQFHTVAGADGFYELLEAYLGALLHPDFTDEEIRREVAHIAAVREQN